MEENTNLDSTQAVQKLWTTFYSLLDTEDFRTEVMSIRKKYDIPESGFAEVEYADDEYVSKDKEVLRIPKLLDGSGFEKEIETLVEQRGFSFFWNEVFKFYIAYNKVFEFGDANLGALVGVFDGNWYLNETEEHEYPEGQYFTVDHIDVAQLTASEQPVFISVSPYASQRDIIDFVKRMYISDIKPIQDKYKKPNVHIGKARKQNEKILVRNQFIYDNRDKSAKEIASLVREHFRDVIDYTYISKIIRDEEAKRK